jgi:hypothetical protein
MYVHAGDGTCRFMFMLAACLRRISEHMERLPPEVQPAFRSKLCHALPLLRGTVEERLRLVGMPGYHEVAVSNSPKLWQSMSAVVSHTLMGLFRPSVCSALAALVVQWTQL